MKRSSRGWWGSDERMGYPPPVNKKLKELLVQMETVFF
jgi:hypothetical protein